MLRLRQEGSENGGTRHPRASMSQGNRAGRSTKLRILSQVERINRLQCESFTLQDFDLCLDIVFHIDVFVVVHTLKRQSILGFFVHFHARCGLIDRLHFE